MDTVIATETYEDTQAYTIIETRVPAHGGRNYYMIHRGFVYTNPAPTHRGPIAMSSTSGNREHARKIARAWVERVSRGS